MRAAHALRRGRLQGRTPNCKVLGWVMGDFLVIHRLLENLFNTFQFIFVFIDGFDNKLGKDSEPRCGSSIGMS